MTTLIFYQRNLYSRGWSCVSQHFRHINRPFFNARRLALRLLCVLWRGALDRLWLLAALFVRVCSTTGYITSGLRGSSLQALTLFGGVGFIARRLRRPEKGNADGVRGILELPAAFGFGPAIGPTLKMALCHIHTLVGRRINNG